MALGVSEALQDTLVVLLHLLLLLLFLFELQADELIFLMRNGAILNSLTLKLFSLVFKVPDDIFEFLDTLRLRLFLLLLRLILDSKL